MRSEFRQACRTGFKTEGLVYAGFYTGCGFSIIEMDIAERKDGDYSNFRFLCVNSVSNAKIFFIIILTFSSNL